MPDRKPVVKNTPKVQIPDVQLYLAPRCCISSGYEPVERLMDAWRFESSQHRVTYATKSHYENNKEYYLEKALRRSQMIKEFVRSQKEKPCVDCGIQYPYYVMQFDHLGEKSFNIGNGVASGNLSKLQAEIDKCEVVCANCHAERTHSRHASIA